MMKKNLPLSLLFCLCLTVLVAAKAGPEIPVPHVTAREAIELAENYFYSSETRNIDRNVIKNKEYILICAIYTNTFNKGEEKEWGWKITFIHPQYNDHSVDYKVTNDRKLVFLRATE